MPSVLAVFRREASKRPHLHSLAWRSPSRPGRPSSWRGCPRAQQPDWPDAAALDGRAASGCGSCRRSSSPARRARCCASLGEVAEGRAFLLQAGDCAESFRDVSAVAIREQLKVLLQMSAVLTYGATLPVVKVGRIAGQFAKPRSARPRSSTASSCRRSAATSSTPTSRRAEARVPDPERMVQGYYQAVSTLNLLRAFTKGGFADLTQVHTWNQEFVAELARGPPLRGDRRRDRPRAALHAGDRDRPRRRAHDPRGRRLDEPRGRSCSTTRSRSTRKDSTDRRLVRLLGAHALDRRADAPARRRARRVLRGRPQPDRRQARADGDAGRGRRALRAAQPRPRPGPADAHRADGRRARAGGAAAACSAPCARRGIPVVWACDPMHAQHVRHAVRAQDAALRRRDAARSRASSPRTARSARGRAASTSSSPART